MKLRTIALATLVACMAGCGSLVLDPEDVPTTRIERPAGDRGPLLDLLRLGKGAAHSLGVVASREVQAVALRPLDEAGDGAEQSYAVLAAFGSAPPERVATVHVHDPSGLSIATTGEPRGATVIGIGSGLGGEVGGNAAAYATMDEAMGAVQALDASR